MNPSPTPRSHPNPLVAWKDLRRMTLKLIRFLDATAPITLVCLALFVGAATTGLGF